MKQERIALIINLSIWIVFFTGVIVIPVPIPEEEPKIFGEMSIRLEPIPQKPQDTALEREVETAAEQEAVTSDRSVEQVQSSVEVSTPIVQERSQQTSSPTQSVATETQGQRRPQVLAKSIEELIAEQNNRSQSSSEPQWTDDVFFESSAATSSQSQVVQPPTQSNSSLRGSAANTSSASDTVVAQGVSTGRSESSTNVSTETSNLLSGIASANPSDSETQGSTIHSGTSQPGTPAQNSASGYSIYFEGEPRRLLSPENPTLEISPENHHLIRGNRDIRISFTVAANGTVSPSSITFTPSSLVPAGIQSELRQQIATWRFQQGQSSGQASFNYSIIQE